MDDKDDIFVLEKLFRGSIVNHNSFLMNDDMDTDALCKTNLNVYFIHIDRVNALREKYNELDQALDVIERDLVDINKREPAIDYIVVDELSNKIAKKDKTKKDNLSYTYRCKKVDTRTKKEFHDYKE